MIKAGFIVRNKFQIRQFEPLADAFPGSDFLLYDRKGLSEEFSQDEMQGFSLPIKLFDRRNIVKELTAYDVIFFQTVFPGIELLDSVPLVAVQYGLAKERHINGEWRALADLNLMYGEYSAGAVSHFGPSVAVGNVKFCGWNYRLTTEQKNTAKAELGLNQLDPVVLYMPTYGELGSFDELVKPLAALSDRYQIVIKGHHNDEMAGAKWMDRARALGHRRLFTGGTDQRKLLEAADAVISDFSGAVFDAVYAEIPVVLYQSRAAERVGKQKFDLSSLEYRERDQLGRVCHNVEGLELALEELIRSPSKYVEKAAALRRRLFVDVSSSTSVLVAREAVEKLLAGHFPKPSLPQTYVRETVQKLLKAELELKLANKRGSKETPRNASSLIFNLCSAALPWLKSRHFNPLGRSTKR